MAAVSALAVAAGGAAATWGMARWRAARAEARHPPEGEFVEVNGRRIHAAVTGEGPDLVLIHGAFGSSRDFTFDLATRLAERYRVIAMDQPGLGYSDHAHPRYARAFARHAESPAEKAELLAAAARKLGAPRPIVAGFSLGGIVAIAWALDHDPAALVLLAGVAMPWPGALGGLYRVNGTALGGGLVAPLVSAWTPSPVLRNAVASAFAPLTPPKGYLRHVGPYMPARLAAFRATTRQVNRLRPHVVKMEKRYGRLSLPVELLHGAADLSVPLEVHALPFSKIVEGARLRVLDGVGHMPHHADPEAAVAAIDRAAARADLA